MALMVDKELPDVFGVAQAPRKTVSQLKNTDPAKAEEQLRKSKDFAIKMILSSAKNIDPFSEDSGNDQATQVMQTANFIAQIDAAMAQTSKMSEVVEAIKNPGYNALELQGKEVSYDNSKRSFDGKEAVKFDYKLSCADENKGSSISSTIKIKDKDGKVVYEAKGANKLGDHSYIWDGKGKKGDTLPEGRYYIEVSASGSKTINDMKIISPIHATTSLSGIVKSTEVLNGVVKSLQLEDGTIIDKDHVISIKDVLKPESAAELSPKLIGNKVELDFSRVQVSDGTMDVYFNNHVQNQGKTIIDVYNAKNKLVKTLETTDIKNKGTSKITFSKTELENGNYTVQVKVEDKDQSDRATKLDSKFSAIVVGINYVDKTFITIDDKQFKAHNINSILANYTSEIDRRAAQYQGSTAEYNDSSFAFAPNSFGPEVIAQTPEEDGAVISHELLRIYNQSDDLVATLQADYNPFEQLDEESEMAMRLYLIGLQEGEYATLNPAQRLDANRHIEGKLKTGEYKFKGNSVILFEKGYRKLNFPNWNGAFGETAPAQLRGQFARNGEVFKTEHSTVYVKNDGANFHGNSIIDKNISLVTSVDKENGELFLNLQNGKRILENQVLRFVAAKS